MNSIYRKSSLEKLSSPEQLDKMIHITKASTWFVLLGMSLIIVAAAYWAFYGELSEKTTAKGIYIEWNQTAGLQDNDVMQEQDYPMVLCYVPLSTGRKIRQGMDVNIMPSSINLQETGYLLGRVVAVGRYGISEEEMQLKLKDDMLVQSFRSQGIMEPVIEVEIQLSRDENTKSGYAWSNKKGSEVSLSDYTMVRAEIITKSITPFRKFISSIN